MPTAPLILIAEDNYDVRVVLAGFLEHCGYRLALANERAVAEQLLAATEPALVITDVVMRGGSGMGLVKIAQERHIPVLLISGEPQVMQQLEGGPIPFLHKPFRLAELERAITRLLSASGKNL